MAAPNESFSRCGCRGKQLSFTYNTYYFFESNSTVYLYNTSVKRAFIYITTPLHVQSLRQRVPKAVWLSRVAAKPKVL
jgi:hypothetical protein